MKLSPLAAALVVGTLCTAEAHAYGTLVAPAGSTAKIQRSRMLVVRYPDKVQLTIQLKTTGTAANYGWLLPLVNINNPADNGVSVGMANKAALDELDEITAPSFTGTCNGAPSGEAATALFGDAWQNGGATVSARLISAPEITAGDLAQYLAGRSFEVTPEVQTAIDDLHDQNFMFAVVNVDGMPGAGVDPIVRVEYPLAAGTDVKLGLSTSAAALAGDRIDLQVWTLDATQMKANLPTKAWDLAGVQFISVDETNYELLLADWLNAAAQRQTQSLLLEYGAPADGFDTAELDNAFANSGAAYLTRMRASFLPLAATANKTMTIKSASGAADYPREHELTGRDCAAAADAGAPDGGEPPTPDASGPTGGTDGSGGAPADAGGGIGGPPANDAGPTGGGGGGGGGCQTALSPRSSAGLLFGALAAALSALNLGRRRRRP